MSQGVQGCPSSGMAERGEGSGGCNRGDGLPPGTGNVQGGYSLHYALYHIQEI